jgi:hypothetical protein
MRTIGIDLAVTAAHQAIVMAEAGRFMTSVISLHSRREKIDELVARAREGVGADYPLRAVMEPTGMALLSTPYYSQEGAYVYTLVTLQQLTRRIGLVARQS